jgi:hypothetical protein
LIAVEVWDWDWDWDQWYRFLEAGTEDMSLRQSDWHDGDCKRLWGLSAEVWKLEA